MQMTSKRDPRTIAEGVDRSADYDVIVVGGAFSGSSSALLLKRQFPDLRVLIIERTAEFKRKVGESTSEVAGCFLTRVLRVGMHLSTRHVTKHGLRMWFHKDGTAAPGRSTELGPAFQARFATFQLNRMELDVELLRECEKLGCELARPATIKDLELGGIGKNSLTFKADGGEPRTVTAGWVVDASGKAAKIAKMRKTWRSNAEVHPTAAIWSRFKNINPIDSAESVEKMAGTSDKVTVQRGYATNHLMGFGWWCWIIPLGSGEVSVGLTWDSRLFTPPSQGKMSERLKQHILTHPVGKVIFEHAEAVEDDNCYYKGLAYHSEEIGGNGFTIVGDACGFMDPLYSQGLDYCAHTLYSSYTALRSYYSGECPLEQLAHRNKEFVRSYFDWFNALYKDKYWYIGDAEIMHAAFLMDIGTYFIGPVRGVYFDEEVEFDSMPYNGKIGHGFAVFMAFYNRRFVKLAKKKIAANCYGDKNLDESYLILTSFNPDPSAIKHIFKGLKIWLKLELRYAFKPAAEEEREPSVANPLPQAAH